MLRLTFKNLLMHPKFHTWQTIQNVSLSLKVRIYITVCMCACVYGGVPRDFLPGSSVHCYKEEALRTKSSRNKNKKQRCYCLSLFEVNLEEHKYVVWHFYKPRHFNFHV